MGTTTCCLSVVLHREQGQSTSTTWYNSCRECLALGGQPGRLWMPWCLQLLLGAATVGSPRRFAAATFGTRLSHHRSRHIAAPVEQQDEQKVVKIRVRYS